MAADDGSYTFDSFAPTVASLFERIPRLLDLYCDCFPTVVVDEFQDTNSDQWNVLRWLAGCSTIICLADPDQRIYDWIPGVHEGRVQEAIDHLHPTSFDLGGDNFRSPRGGILSFANAVLTSSPITGAPEGVAIHHYSDPRSVLVVVHQLIPMLERFLQEKLGVDPSIAVVTRTNSFLEAISQELSHSTTLPSGKVVAPVDHELLWDVALSTAAGYVVASILEWPSKTPTAAVVRTLECIIDYHQTAVADGSRSAAPMSDTLLRALASLQAGISPRSKTAKLLLERAEAGIALVGDPIRDWQLARSLLAGTRELDDIFQKVRMLRLLRARDPLVWTLIRSWDGSSSYPGAVTHIQQVLQEEVLNSTYISDSAVILMSMHKSKGKEFDGVVIVEGLHHSKLLDPSWDSQATNAARRLLRVAITRARHQVIIVRPNHSVALIPPAVKE